MLLLDELAFSSYRQQNKMLIYIDVYAKYSDYYHYGNSISLIEILYRNACNSQGVKYSGILEPIFVLQTYLHRAKPKGP